MANLADMALLAWLAEDELARQRAVVKAQKYHDGEHPVYLSERLQQFLAGQSGTAKPMFRLNVCRSVVTALTEKLIVTGFDAPNTQQAANELARVWAQAVWQTNQMDARADDVHEGALRDGECFVIVDWDDANQRVRLTHSPRYCDVTVDGDGFGCRAFYLDDDPNQELLYVSKRWTETYADANGATKARQRETRYYADRVEKYVSAGATWVQWKDVEGEAWPLPWMNPQTKQPLGIAAIHFKNKSLRCEAWDAIPIQDAINKALVDLIASADQTAFRVFKAFGFTPTSDGQDLKADGSNAWTLTPATVVGSTLTPSEASFDVIEGADVTPLAEIVQQLVLWMDAVTGTPAARHIATKQVASEGTLKEQNEPLLAKARLRQSLFGNGWEDAMRVARNVANAFGGAGLDETAQFATQWAELSPRSRKDLLDELTVKREKLAVPVEQTWREAGYTQEQIDAMKQSDEYKARVAMMQVSLSSQQVG